MEIRAPNSRQSEPRNTHIASFGFDTPVEVVCPWAAGAGGAVAVSTICAHLLLVVIGPWGGRSGSSAGSSAQPTKPATTMAPPMADRARLKIRP